VWDAPRGQPVSVPSWLMERKDHMGTSRTTCRARNGTDATSVQPRLDGMGGTIRGACRPCCQDHWYRASMQLYEQTHTTWSQTTAKQHHGEDGLALLWQAAALSPTPMVPPQTGEQRYPAPSAIILSSSVLVGEVSPRLAAPSGWHAPVRTTLCAIHGSEVTATCATCCLARGPDQSPKNNTSKRTRGRAECPA
jgi:hypothetical protein